MLRQLHAWPGVILALLLIVLATSGAVLSTQPLAERLVTPAAAPTTQVAELASRVAHQVPGVERIERRPSGMLVARYTRGADSGAVRIDPNSGAALGPYQPSPTYAWMRDLHRAFFIGTPGHAMAGVGAIGMLLLSFSGLVMLARRQGGWRNLLGSIHGNGQSRWHSQVSRLLLPLLILIGASGLYLSADTFGLVRDGMDSDASFPTSVSQGSRVDPGQLTALRNVALSDLRELDFPAQDNPQDAYTLRTAQGDGYVDAVDGRLLGYQPHDLARHLYEYIYQLHTGDLLGVFSPLLGLAALGVPLLGITGLVLFLRRRRSVTHGDAKIAPEEADCVILVGSESNGTWAFARTLQQGLMDSGRRVYSAPLNQGTRAFPAARQLLVLTSTYGDGGAPQSARGFLEQLDDLRLADDARFAVLGFGDRRFPRFCQYAKDVETALLAHGLAPLMARQDIDAASVPSFQAWAQDLGERLGITLNLVHSAEPIACSDYQLIERRLHQAPGDTPLVVLRFAPLGQPVEYQAGDLLAIQAPGAQTPRYYSLASDSDHGVLEICVRLCDGGLCSTYLHGLEAGARVSGFVQPHREFRPEPGSAPLILIGAGSGIGPLVGFIRRNARQRRLYLYWGGRVPEAGVPFDRDLDQALADGRLSDLRTAFSAGPQRAYVQDRLSQDAHELRHLVAAGAQVLVCGGRNMADGVRHAFDEMLAPLALSVDHLRAGGRYREDLF
ncbi:PepSY domain-containing protein [Pseudomonas panipatensis]|uniref:Sulfite reductase (NADPH) flavoprotein alpha-component n=1 Tax=Pseudomonas panipatensis TaxID=428992 RepID=A0A1G8L2L8_9PSED|nr:PepSY domain-containing protein [Pseudomonas panipatensis]SDI49905.1 sulfite reductase (NADPH) flavoprotein alpha-component [Pseudomonas panipatensis]SMP72644.1 sulfite reductase (NADPH) flavoprotein alpha-component [Pseudomonas panipatensis]